MSDRQRVWLRRRKTSGVLLAVMLAAHAALVAWGCSRHTPNWDEIGHLPSGISHWRYARFDLYRVNPPLVRMVAALPVLAAQPQTDWTGFRARRGEFHVGQRFVKINGEKSFWYFTLARWACLPFSIIGAYVCFRWARDLYGPAAGLMAGCLWCFSPHVLAYAQMMTPAVGSAALGLAAGYGFWGWLKQPGWRRATATGLLLGLAELAKATWIILFALWPLLWIMWRLADRSRPGNWLRQSGQLAWMFIIAVFLINMCYGFEGSLRRLGDYDFASRALAGEESDHSVPPIRAANRFRDTWLGSLPVPLPANYVSGLDVLKQAFEAKMWSYLRGEWRHGGWWYYYVYALLVKVPLGTWIVLLAAVAISVSGGAGFAARWRDELVLLAPGLVVLTVVSSQTGFNHHLRYVLPVFPCAFIWVGRIAQFQGKRKRAVFLLVSAGLAWSLTSSIWIWPHSLSYFNESVGGPRWGHAHLGGSPVDTNIDCGQDLLYLQRWLRRHPEVGDSLEVALNGPVDPSMLGIAASEPPPGIAAGSASSTPADALGPLPGWYAVSVNRMRSRDNRHAYFLWFEPTAMVGYSIYVFHIERGEANRVRVARGLPSLPPNCEDD